MKVQMGKQGKKNQKLIVIVTYSKAFSPCFPFWVNLFLKWQNKSVFFFFWFSTYLLNFKKEVKKGQILD
jgi:hypothetical protein